MADPIKPPVKADSAPVRAQPGHVKCRILPLGDGKISSGEHVPMKGDIMFARGDVCELPEAIAQGLERTGYVEIQ